MRKFLSLIISLIIAFMSVADGVVAFANTSKDNGLNSFAENLTEMIRENDSNLNIMNDIENDEDFVKADVFCGNVDFSDKTFENLPEDAFLTRRLIVKSKKVIDYYGAIDCVSGYNDLYILQYDTENAVKSAYKYYLNCDYIEYVEPDIIMSTQETLESRLENPDGEGTEYNEFTAEAIEWLSNKIGFSDIKDKLATMIADDYVLVAILDSGVDTDHELLADRLVESSANVSSTGEADSVEDDYGHGTHVAGIVVNNTLENVKIKPYKVLNKYGNGSLSSIALAVDMAVADGVDVINMSLSGDGESKRMTEAVNNAVANDINVVVAAGNRSLDLDEHYISPACVESAITVSATDKKDNLADYSNYDGTIDIATTGTDIESSYLNNTYLSMSGTSMATPQVTAGLAIIQTVFADKPAIECEEMIKDYAIAMFENEGENHFGAGLLFLKYLLDGKPTTADPVFSVDSCSFFESFKLTLSCPEKGADIYYVVYGTGDLDEVNWFDSFKYSSPITISVDTKVSAIAIGKGKKPSSIVTVEYDRVIDSEEDNYDINILGYITGYYGSETDLFIPEKIKGRTVKGIASDAFESNNFIHTVVLPNTAEKINSNAFNGCTHLKTVSGNGVEQIGANAFENSSVSTVTFKNLKEIGNRAFADCKNLTEIDLTNVEKIGDYAFNNSGLIEVDCPRTMSIGMNAFNSCSSLKTVLIPVVEKIEIGAFRNCTSLETVNISSATEIAANAFRNTVIKTIDAEKVEKIGNYVFADNSCLQKVSLPNVVITGTYVFQNCSVLSIVSLPLLESLNSNTFNKCPELKWLYLPSVKDVVKNAFASSSIEFLRFDCIEKISSLPNSLKTVMFPSSLNNITISAPSTEFVVYGYTGTYAEKFATDNNKEFYSVPAITYDIEDKVDTEKGYIWAYAIGFNCTYQWYKNDEFSNEGGTLIEDATSYYYVPDRNDNAVAYYCVITSNDGTNVNTITTKCIENAPEYRDADYTEYNALYITYQNIDKSLYKDGAFDEVDELFKTDVSQFSLAEQDTLNELVEKIKDLIANAELKYILCDINADGKISVIDARLALKAVVGSYTLDKTQTLAADINGDGKISIADSRAILKSVLDQ